MASRKAVAAVITRAASKYAPGVPGLTTGMSDVKLLKHSFDSFHGEKRGAGYLHFEKMPSKNAAREQFLIGTQNSVGLTLKAAAQGRKAPRLGKFTGSGRSLGVSRYSSLGRVSGMKRSKRRAPTPPMAPSARNALWLP